MLGHSWGIVMALMTAGGSTPAVAAGSSGGRLADDAFLEQYAATYRFGAGKPTQLSVTPEGDAVLFLRSGPRNVVNDLYELDVRSGKERVLLTAEGILRGAEEKLSPEELARRERQRQVARGIAAYRLSEDGKRILVVLSGRRFVIERQTGTTRELPAAAGAASFSAQSKASRCAA